MALPRTHIANGPSKKNPIASEPGKRVLAVQVERLEKVSPQDSNVEHCNPAAVNEDFPAKVTADSAFQYAIIEYDKALARVVVGLMQYDTGMFKQFSDNESIRR